MQYPQDLIWPIFPFQIQLGKEDPKIMYSFHLGVVFGLIVPLLTLAAVNPVNNNANADAEVENSQDPYIPSPSIRVGFGHYHLPTLIIPDDPLPTHEGIHRGRDAPDDETCLSQIIGGEELHLTTIVVPSYYSYAIPKAKSDPGVEARNINTSALPAQSLSNGNAPTIAPQNASLPSTLATITSPPSTSATHHTHSHHCNYYQSNPMLQSQVWWPTFMEWTSTDAHTFLADCHGCKGHFSDINKEGYSVTDWKGRAFKTTKTSSSAVSYYTWECAVSPTPGMEWDHIIVP